MAKFERFDFSNARRYSVEDRPSKVGVGAFASPVGSDSLSDFLGSLPDFLAAKQLRTLVSRVQQARRLGKPIIWGFGGHVIKVGLAPVLVDLMDRGFVTALATNGSGVIHDFELALFGKTSEDVEQQLVAGDFGMAEETGKGINQAVIDGFELGLGFGVSVGRFLDRAESVPSGVSVLLEAYRREIPVTVHVAVGTDIIHCHPEASGEAIGATSLRDFQMFTGIVAQLEGGGVYLNLGSAVILPEVFLKAVTAVRNAGTPLRDLVTANLDFLQHYRPTQNVVRRPVAGSGTGISLTGHHEIMIPLLAGLLIHCEQPSDAG